MSKVCCKCGDYIRRGTTPFQEFTFSECIEEYDEMLITYMQAGSILFEKRIEDMTVSGNTASFRLSQEETLALDAGRPLLVQVRALNGGAAASTVIKLEVKPVLNTSIMGE